MRALAESGRVLVAAAQACLAAFAGSDELWKPAEDVRDMVKNAGGVSSLNCIGVSAFGLLDQLVSHHKANPGGKFESRPGGAKEASSCPRIKSLSPNRGNPGQDVTVEVTNPGQVAAVKVRTQFDVEFEKPTFTVNGAKLEFKMPAKPEDVKKVCVAILARPDTWEWEVASKEFTYTDPATEAPDDFSCLGN